MGTESKTIDILPNGNSEDDTVLASPDTRFGSEAPGEPDAAPTVQDASPVDEVAAVAAATSATTALSA